MRLIFICALTCFSMLSSGQWQQVLPNVNVWALLAIGDTILVGTDDGQVLLSPDLGATWVDRSGNLPTGYVKGIGVAAGNRLTCAASGRIYLSDDWSTWTAVSPYLGGPTDMLVRDSTILVALEINGGLQASFDLGTSWQQIGLGYGTSVSLSSSNDTILLGKFGSNLQRTVDHGATWTNVNGVIGTTIFSLAEEGLYAGSETALYRRVNNGWTTEPLSIQVLDIKVKDNYVAACGDPNGPTANLHLSIDYGNNWDPIDQPYGFGRVEITEGSLFGGVQFGGAYGLWKLDLADWVGIQEPQASSVPVLSPNPANDLLSIDLPEPGRDPIDLEVTDLTGRVISRTRVPAFTSRFTVAVQDLAPGRYAITLRGARSFSTRPFLVVR